MSLNVSSGTPPFTYQWYKDGTALAGATADSLVISNVQIAAGGVYSAVVANSAGSATSDNATLTVNSPLVPPAFTTQPASQTVTAGGAVTFSVAASGTPAPTYQWYFNGSAIAGATGASYTLPGAQPANAGTYTVVATNPAGAVTSTAATLAVNFAPFITAQPAGKTVALGAAVTFSVAASGSPAPSYQWQFNGSSIAGATAASYTISSVKAANAGTYTVVVANAVGSVTSSAAALAINGAPVITAQPATQTVVSGHAVTFAVVASGTPVPTYQWRRNGVNLGRATGATYTISRVTAGNAGTYTVVVSNSAGTVTSAGAVLTVRSAPYPLVTRTDFNGDGKSDILWQNTATGDCGLWLMSSTAISGVEDLGTMSADWQICGSGDFNGDGQSDILWQNNSTGDRCVWLMSGAVPGSVVDLGPVSTDWQICGSGDFNGDGQSDILWQNKVTGDCCLWLMSGTALASVVDLGTVSTDWQICGAGDFNGDGQSDILLQNKTTRQCSVWLMAGTTVGSIVSPGTPAAGWVVVGAGDFNADGQSDILLQNPSTGAGIVWLMSGTKVSSTASLGTLPAGVVMRN